MVVPEARSDIFARRLVRLLQRGGLIRIVRLFVNISIVVLRVQVFICHAYQIRLRAICAVVRGILRVVRPILLPKGELPRHLHRHVLLQGTRVVLSARPGPRIVPRPVRATSGRPVIFFLQVTDEVPVDFDQGLLVIPFLFDQGVVAFLRPLQFRPRWITESARLARACDVVRGVRLIFRRV